MPILERGAAAQVIVVGSGPTGGFAAHELAKAGVQTLLLEAGDRVDATRLDTHAYPFQLPGRASPAPFYGDDIGAVEYRTRDVVWVDRVRVLGGRSMHWNAVCLRFSEDDFRERTVSGIEVDWPLDYAELAPFYAYVERTIGIVGTREGLRVAPDSEYVGPPPPFRCAEMLAERACRKLGIRMIPTRKALAMTARPSRGACHFCGHCMSGCHTASIFNTSTALLPGAQATGALTVRTGALVRQVLVDERGRARGVSVVDRATGREEELRAGAVVLGCSTVETARLLLNSTSPRFPYGLGNDHDLVGRHLGGHTTGEVYGYLTELTGRPMTNEDGALDHSIIPRFEPRHRTGAYKGGFQIQTQYIRYDYPHHASRVPGFGTKWKARVRALQPAMLQMGGFGKVLTQRENRVTVDPHRPDRFGIPLPIVEFGFADEDRALHHDMMMAIREIHDVAGVELAFGSTAPSGLVSHEIGTCRMGADPATSVTNRFGQLHGVPNVAVVDGSTFPTLPEKNPTLTMMALAVRNTRHLLAEKRRLAF